MRALVLPGEDEARLRSLGVEILRGDLREGASLDAALKGIDLCFHLAGINSYWMARRRDYYEINVKGVRHLLEAAKRAGVKRVVHTSSVVTIGERKGEVGNEETIHRGYFLSDYERSKYLGEKEALKAAGRDLEVVVVNPSSAYGPGRTGGSGKMFLDFLRGRLPGLFGSTINLLFIEDMIKGHLLAAERGRPGQRYILAGENLSVEQAFRIAANIAGLADVPRRISSPLVWAIAWASQLRSFFTKEAPRLSLDQVRTLLHGILVDNAKARRDLGMKFTPFAEGLAVTMEGYRRAGLIPERRAADR